MNSSKIVANRVGKAFVDTSGRSVQALKDVSLTVGQGRFVSLVGPSGCGKSTFLYIIAGFILPSQGEVLVDGKEIIGPGSNRGIVFQEYALFNWRTALENVMYGLEMKGLPKAERIRTAQKYIDFVNLTGFENRYPRELSGGMKQRVAIARTLAHNPDILLMDEPFGSLDAQTRESMQEELLRIWKETGKTILFVTHDIDEAIYLSQEVVIMTARPGAVKEIVKVPLNKDLKKESLLTSKEYLETRLYVWKQVRDEVLKPKEGLF